MRLTQGALSNLPDLADEHIGYCQQNGGSIGVDHTDDRQLRNTHWQMPGEPMSGRRDPAAEMFEIHECRQALGNPHSRIVATDATRMWESLRLGFVVTRPASEPDVDFDRSEPQSRDFPYMLRTFGARSKPIGEPC